MIQLQVEETWWLAECLVKNSVNIIYENVEKNWAYVRTIFRSILEEKKIVIALGSCIPKGYLCYKTIICHEVALDV